MTALPLDNLENEIRELIVSALKLEEVDPSSIDVGESLFEGGLGLDSIDALELALSISKTYGFQLRSDSEDNKRVFASLRALSAYIEQQRSI